MSIDLLGSLEPEPAAELTWARGRRPGSTYLNKSFRLWIEGSRDYGQPARYVVRVFDPLDNDESDEAWEWMEFEIQRSAKGRVQVTAMIAREAGAVREIRLQKVTANRVTPLVRLDRTSSQAFIEFMKNLEYVPAEGAETVRIDDEVIRDFFMDPSAMPSLYERDPDAFRLLIREDRTARDLIALARRRQVIERFRTWLRDADAFDAAREAAGGREKAWQQFFEENPWILGVGLSGQLLTSWMPGRLEQWVGGFNLRDDGKRIDALMRTKGSINSMVLAEIKHHETPLLSANPYRPGCWSPSRELAGGVVQAQRTADRAHDEFKGWLADTAPDGSDMSTGTYVVRPRSFLIVGQLGQLLGQDGHIHRDKFHSFELHRRSLHEPEILTFDEVLARAEWQVDRLEGHDESGLPEVTD